MATAREDLVRLMKRLRSRDIQVAEFCEQYEPIWNFELQEADLAEGEAAIFERVFNVVAWYNPFPEERETYSGFKSEAAVAGAVAEALENLAE